MTFTNGILLNNTYNETFKEIRESFDKRFDSIKADFLKDKSQNIFLKNILDSFNENVLCESTTQESFELQNNFNLENARAYLKEPYQLFVDLFEKEKKLVQNCQEAIDSTNKQFYTFDVLKKTKHSLSEEEIKKQELLNFYNTEIYNIDFAFAEMWRDDAIKMAEKNPYLEKLKNVPGKIVIADYMFVTDIPYATKGINKILEIIANEQNITITVTSALGTKGKNVRRLSPHSSKNKILKSHFNINNPKIDIALPQNSKAREVYIKKLKKTGWVQIEAVHDNHVCVYIKPEAFKAVLEMP